MKFETRQQIKDPAREQKTLITCILLCIMSVTVVLDVSGLLTTVLAPTSIIGFFELNRYVMDVPTRWIQGTSLQ